MREPTFPFSKSFSISWGMKCRPVFLFLLILSKEKNILFEPNRTYLPNTDRPVHHSRIYRCRLFVNVLVKSLNFFRKHTFYYVQHCILLRVRTPEYIKYIIWVFFVMPSSQSFHYKLTCPWRLFIYVFNIHMGWTFEYFMSRQTAGWLNGWVLAGSCFWRGRLLGYILCILLFQFDTFWF